MPRLSSVSVVTALLAVVGCSKSPSENKQPAGSGSAAPVAPAGSGSGAEGSGSGSAEAPPEAATVVGPTRSAKGTVEVTGKITGSFEWKKKDQKSPISCAWDPEKEIGGLKVDLSDGAGTLMTVTIDVPPSELGPARLDITSAELPEPQKTYTGFKVRGDEERHITVTFDNTPLPEPADKKDKTVPLLTLKGAVEVTCPPKK